MTRTVRIFINQGGRSSGRGLSTAAPSVNDLERESAPIPLTDGDVADAAADADRPAPPEDPQMVAGVVKSEEDWAKVNAQRKEVVQSTWKADPLWKIALSRKLQVPLQGMRGFKMKRSGLQ